MLWVRGEEENLCIEEADPSALNRPRVGDLRRRSTASSSPANRSFSPSHHSRLDRRCGDLSDRWSKSAWTADFDREIQPPIELKSAVLANFSPKRPNGPGFTVAIFGSKTSYTNEDNLKTLYCIGALIVTKCEVVSPSLEMEIKSDAKKVESGILLKPKQEAVPKSAAQIVDEQCRNSAPAARMAMTRRVHPLVSLNPYQGNWTIKVRVTNKGNLRSYKNARGEGFVFNIELTDEDGTQIQATMFNEAASKFYPKFELGKVYYISKGSLRVANRQFRTVLNDYEMNLNENSIVEEADGEAFIPETKYNFVKIDQLGSYVNGRELVDIIGIVQNVSPTLSVRRKSDNETIPKRDITVADDSNKTVTVSLWNELATNAGQELLDMADTTPVVAIKCLKVGDFQGVSLSTVSRSTVLINPDSSESKKLRTWHDSEGKAAPMASVGSNMNFSSKAGSRSLYSDRILLSHITNDPTLGQDKPVFFSIKVYVTYIKPDQTMWYRACKTCNKKVTEAVGSGYWCEGCQKNNDQCSLRYIMVVKVSDHSGEAWLSIFNEQAEKIIGCTANDLERIKTEEGDEKYQLKLKEATWVQHLF